MFLRVQGELLKVLGIPADKLVADQMIELQGLLREYSDVLALIDQELGCISIVRHSISDVCHKYMTRTFIA